MSESEDNQTSAREREIKYLNSAVVFVVVEAERTESTVDAVKAVHIALALVRMGVKFALHEELLSEKRL